MYLALASVSTDPVITRPVLDRIGHTLERQLYRDYAPLWQSTGVPVRVFDHVQAIPEDEEASPLIVFDDPDQAGVLGWHTVSPNGRPYGRAFWKVIEAHDGKILEGALSLSVTLSHEALEMVGDPYVNWWADTDKMGEEECLELCDRTQADSYEIEGVAVSNFLGPRAFRAGTGPYDLMRLLGSPWEIRPGGYAIRRKNGDVYPVWGASFPAWLREIKMTEGSRSFRRLDL